MSVATKMRNGWRASPLPELPELATGEGTNCSVSDLLRASAGALQGADIDTARLDAEVLLANAWGLDRAQLYARTQELVPATVRADFARMLARRVTREPLQYIVGRQEFWSLEFEVNADVLIPRPETELLVQLTVAELQQRAVLGGLVCDVGTGSGCIAVALARELRGVMVWASDQSATALAVAARNAERHAVAGRVHCVRSDLLAQVPEPELDVIVSNPPYVPTDAVPHLQPEVRWEPRSALDGGASGLVIIGRLLAEARPRLRAGGVLIVEVGADQEGAVTALARATGWSNVVIRRDLAGLPRVLVAGR